MATVAFTGLLLGVLLAHAEEDLPDIPDPVGRAGMMAAVLVDADGREVILAAGGANFPDAPPWSGGVKVFHRDIYLLEERDRRWGWRKVGDLPAPCAYAAWCAAPDRKRLIVAGGAAGDRHNDAVWAVAIDGTVEPFAAAMPQPRAYGGCGVVGDTLVVLGGSRSAADTAALPTLVRLSLTEPERGWVEAAGDPSRARIVPLLGVFGDSVVWGGGCSLTAVEGRPRRVYRDDLHRDDLDSGAGAMLQRLESPFAGAAGPGVACRGGLLFVGGDDGSRGGVATADHPGQSRRVLCIDPETGRVTDVGRWPTPLATAPLLRLGDDLVTISGESRPGVRTPAVSRWPIPEHLR